MHELLGTFANSGSDPSMVTDSSAELQTNLDSVEVTDTPPVLGR